MDGQTQQPASEPATNVTLEFHAPDAVGSPAPAKPDVEQLVDAWFRQHFAGLAGSLHDHLFHHVNAAKEELKKLLAAR